MINKSSTYRYWLFEEHFCDLQSYLYEWVEEHARGDMDCPENSAEGTVLNEFVKDPYLGFRVVKDWITNQADSYANVERLLNYIDKPAIFNILVRGMPDSGKTTTVWGLAEKLHKRGYRIVLIAPYVEEDTLPDFVKWKPKIFDLSKGDIGIIDEAALKMSNRGAMTKGNKEAFVTMPVGRHIGAKIILITQMSSETDVKAIRWANVMISKSFATSAMGEKNIERNIITDDPITNYLKPADNYAGIHSSKKDWSIVTADGSNYMMYLPKPRFMTDKLSRTYQKISEVIGSNDSKKIEEFAMKKAKFMKENGYPAMTIYQELGIRGYWRPIEEWMRYTGEIFIRTPKNAND